MMKKIHLIYFIFLLTFTSCSRENWLDIKPKGKTILKTVEDYRKLLDFPRNFSPVPGFKNGYSGTDLASDDFIITDATKLIFNDISVINRHIWSDNIYLPNQDDPDWKLLYGQIYTTNIITEGVMKAEGTEKEKLRLSAEAKVHRAFAYFSLVNLYGPHYGPNASSDVAVPLRLGTELTGVNLSRASVQKIYDLILKNLKNSIPNLPNKPKDLVYNFRPTKQSAYALLARVYLYMGKYSKSLEAASHALAINSTITDFNNNKKELFRFNKNIAPKDPNMSTILVLNQPYEDPQLLWKKSIEGTILLIPSDDLYNLYEDNDLRKKFYIPLSKQIGRDDNKEYVSKKVLYSYAPIRFRGLGFTVPEVLLTQAECNVRLGNVKAAVDALNRLREKRFVTGTYTPITNTNKSEVLNLVKRERRIELVGNGLRYFDLKRYNRFDNANISLTRVLGGKTYTLRAGSKNWVFPIAQKYILQTPEIGKNNRD